jgi:hypothetical protein
MLFLSCIGVQKGMIKIGWPTLQKQVNAQVWRVLDLSGLTKSTRDSKNYTKSGYVFLNDSCITSLRHTVPLGDPFTLELRFPNGRVKGAEIMLVPTNRLIKRKPREMSPGNNPYLNDPPKFFYKG